MTLGKGSVISMTRKQKLNARSSTESELIGTDDVMPPVLWTRYFMEAQGHDIEDNILYQDNTSAMKLEENGKRSSTKRTKHIRVRYFFVQDRIKKGDLTIKYCPTAKMTADHFTKPLQGALFRKFRAEIQGIPNDDTDYSLPPTKAG